MNPIDDQIARLFHAAAMERTEPVGEPAFGLETRVLAAWRAARSSNAGIWDMTLLVRGLIVASVIMAVSFWPAWNATTTPTNPFADFLQLTDTTVPSDEAP